MNIGILIVAILILMLEYDRCGQGYVTAFKDYYLERPERMALGLYNGVVKAHSFNHPAIITDVESWFPEHVILKNNWRVFAEEAQNIYDKYEMLNFNEVSNGDFDRIAGDGKWKVMVLKWYDDPIAASVAMAPKSCEILKLVPNVKSAMISILLPGKVIPPHKGPFKGALRYHLGLNIPKKGQCHITVNGQRYYWQNGEDVLFDDTYVHSVINDTEEIRIVLFCDVIRPLPGLMNDVNKSVINNLSSIADFVKQINSKSEKAISLK